MPKRMKFGGRMKRPKNIDIIIPGLRLPPRNDGTRRANPDRLQISSGTRDKETYLRRRAAIVDLGARLVFPPLRALADGSVSIKELMVAYQGGPDAMEALVKRCDDRLLAPLIEDYLTRKAAHITTGAKVRMQLGRFVEFCGGPSKARVSDLSARHINQFLLSLTLPSGRSVSNGTRNRYRAALSGLATYLARHEQLIDANPIWHGAVEKFEESAARLPDMSAAQYRDYFAHLRAVGDEYVFFARLLIHTGVDVGELLERRTRDLSLGEAGTQPTLWTIRTKIKRAKQRRIPFPQEFRSEATAHIARFGLQGDMPLFGMLDRSRFEAAHKRIRAKVGLPNLRLKDMRHLAAITWRKAGADIQVIQEWLGHATPLQTVAYAAFADPHEHYARTVQAAGQILTAELDVVPIVRSA